MAKSIALFDNSHYNFVYFNKIVLFAKSIQIFEDSDILCLDKWSFTELSWKLTLNFAFTINLNLGFITIASTVNRSSVKLAKN